MEFRLVYQGPLPAQGSSESRLKDKHAIRRQLHRQLRGLWDTHPFISRYTKAEVVEGRASTFTMPSLQHRGQFVRTTAYRDAETARIGAKYERCGFQFVPLIGGAFGEDAATACALDILFLRRDMPGGIIKQGDGGGDLDNRLKVLFDALRMPHNCDEVRKAPPAEANEKPFFVLLEDDSLITEVKVVTDRLLTELRPDEVTNDVHLIIHVRTMAIGSEFADIGFRRATPPPRI